MSQTVGQNIRNKTTTLIEKLLKKASFDEVEAQNLSINIEKGIYNNIIQYSDNNGILKRWDNKHFKNLYVVKAMSVYANLDSESYVGNKRFLIRLNR